MVYKELAQLIEYDIPIIEIYNEQGEIEYILNLDELVFDDIDVMVVPNYQSYGIIKLVRNGQKKDEPTQFND
jgi:hypothetical protein|tara:strand:- start:796 stop:1011 length:216 start_codon:yes stop_codon:yes gene_type:complete